MAAPHVAGVAALVVGAGVKKPDAVEEILLGTAAKPKGRDAGANGRVDDHYGAGIVDAAAALRKARGGRNGEELGLGFAAALLGLALVRRRGIAVGKLGLGALAAFFVGGSGLDLTWAVPASWSHAHAVASVLSTGYTDLASGSLSATLVYSAAAAGAAHALVLRRAPPAPGAGRVRLRRGGRPALRGDRPHRRPPLHPRRARARLAARPGRLAGLFAAVSLRKA